MYGSSVEERLCRTLELKIILQINQSINQTVSDYSVSSIIILKTVQYSTYEKVVAKALASLVALSPTPLSSTSSVNSRNKYSNKVNGQATLSL